MTFIYKLNSVIDSVLNTLVRRKGKVKREYFF